MPLKIVRGDIVNMNTDAIVNAANVALQAGGGVCGAIFQAAGAKELQEACNKIGHCYVGQAVITPGFHLKSRYIIHTVGPIWKGGLSGEAERLGDCYKNSLKLAKEHALKSIAFPLISTGIYAYPQDQALQIATHAIHKFLLDEDVDMEVTLVVFGKNAFQLSNKLVGEVQQYIDDYYYETAQIRENKRIIEEYELADTLKCSEAMYDESPAIVSDSVGTFLSQAAESFSDCLLRRIDERGLKDSTVYHKANVSRQIFSNIRKTKDYQPKKETAISFCIALELNLEDSLDLLSKAGYTLSKSKEFDLIIRYFIENGNYDITLLNETLFHFKQKLLGV
ncbi:macro domain-containing protein [Clostridia bacterium]|nr:macro domain-containing protein [Clostridia bacterium]